MIERDLTSTEDMMTLKQFSKRPEIVPTSTVWYLTDLAEARGKQELYTHQSPQKLKVLLEHALIESAVSSNRLEGVEVDRKRVRAIVLGKSTLHNRNEEEVRGYRNALRLIHEQASTHPVSQKTILSLHHLARGEISDAGKYRKKDADIIEKYPDGTERVRFKTVAAANTTSYTREAINLWDRCLIERWVHPLIALAGFNLDFLCIHPFRDGNGRVSRLLLLLQCYHLGYEVGRYISLERLIEQNKERYYETLEESSQDWHEGNHNPWPYVNFIFFILKDAYREFEERVGQVKSPRGEKTELVKAAVNMLPGQFTLNDLEHACPSVNRDMVRKVLGKLQRNGKIECLGRGPGATWRKRGNSLKRGKK